MFDWNDLRFLLAVQREGSLSGAAKRLRVDATTVSRRIAALERDLKARLVIRSGHGLSLTDVGQRVAERVEGAERAALEIHQLAASSESEQPAGRVRVTMLQDVADALVLPILPELKRRWPLVRIDLWCTSRVVDLAAGHADLAVRVGMPEGGSLVARRLCTLIERPYVSEGWLSERGLRASEISDLDGQEVLLLLAEDRWTEGLGRVRPALRASALSTLIGAAKAGMGVVMAPERLAAAHPDLVMLPSLPASRERDLWLVMAERAANVPRIRVVADLFAERLGDQPGWHIPS